MSVSWSWSTTGYGFASKTTEEIIALCGHAGLGGVEAVTPFLQGLRDNEIEAMGKQFREGGVQIETFHLPFSPADDISSFYETVRRSAVENMKMWIERSALLGASVGVQHPTTARYDAEFEGMDRYISQLARSLDDLLPLAEQFDYTIALENLPPGDIGGRLSSRPAHFERFVREFDHPNLGFILDTGHALISSGPDADEFHRIMAPRMVAYHLADNAGDRDSHLAPGHGAVDWTTVFRRASEIEYSGCMCIETPPFAHTPNGDFQPDDWKQLVDDTAKLANAALAS